jgi:glycosyltransferase involved in cell wall biosynthesis
VCYAGSVGPDQRNTLLGGARALLHLIDFDEPFGLSVVESMATGTPVIAFRRGAMAELIEDGVSGYLLDADDVSGAAAAVRSLSALDRTATRAHVERHFSAERMVDDYLDLYYRILGRDTREPAPAKAAHNPVVAA